MKDKKKAVNVQIILRKKKNIYIYIFQDFSLYLRSVSTLAANC